MANLWLMLFLLPVLAVPVLFLFFYIKCYFHYQHLKRHGIDGPKPVFFYGNHKDRIKLGLFKFLQNLHTDYGPIAGYYAGQNATVSVTDLELIKRVFVKDFERFMNRPPPPFTGYYPRGVVLAADEEWRFMRQILSPTFSSFKTKGMTPLIINCVNSLVEVVQEHANTDKSFDMYKVCSAYTFEAILAAAFGRLIDIQKGQSDELTKALSTFLVVFNENNSFSPVVISMVLSNLPFLLPLLSLLARFSKQKKSFEILYETSEKIIEHRRQNKGSEKYRDMLQSMIDAEESEEGNGTKRTLTNHQIIDNAMTFMLAGSDTTANALGYAFYFLALNKHVQDKCQEDIDQYWLENPEASAYEVSQNIDYLDLVLQEVLRFYPSIALVGRKSKSDYDYNGITIPKNANVYVPIVLIHMDPENWPEPDKFDPLRFTVEEKAKRRQNCYMPFGQGPRTCIGMRFAQLEAKVALVELLRRFTFVRSAETQVPLETVFGITLSPRDGIFIKVVTRD